MKYFSLLIVNCFIFFSVAHAQSGYPAETTIVILSDLNESYGSTHYEEYADSALAYIRRWKPDLVLCTGDMVAGQSKDLSDEDIEAMWKGFDETILTRLREWDIPFAFTIGNHDGSASGSFENERRVAQDFWNKNRPDLKIHTGSRFPFLYSFTFQNLFIIAWDASYHEISDEDLAWMEERLETEEAVFAQHRIVMGHLPLYAVAEGRNRRGEILSGADSLLGFFEKHEVDIYLSGHHHAYYPAEKNGVKLLAMGAQGSGPRPLIGSKKPPYRTLTRLQFSKGDSLSIQTYNLENTMQEIKTSDLPETIEGVNGILYRLNGHSQSN